MDDTRSLLILCFLSTRIFQGKAQNSVSMTRWMLVVLLFFNHCQQIPQKLDGRDKS